ncbi:deoxyribodipyrimidine photo-lyase [Propioniciclava coleopterorum]|uniref:deoxyribodipyrimidine photo-lyase n=1 Tax=Propioniciclava coleopterorum TaxID=2714937 RepID=UPI001FE58E74|nr:deoxyribodipyrimidine photo-lyase [Propioniciclava coleopterorum]
MTAVLWLRRDLRRADLPALAAAHGRASGGEVAVCVALDPGDEARGAAPRAWWAATLLALRETYEGRLTLLEGDPAEALVAFAARLGASSVHVSRETEPAGVARDARVRAALAAAGVDWVETGTPYAVAPGAVLTAAGRPFEIFTPFARRWREHLGEPPAQEPPGLRLAPASGDEGAWARLEARADAAAALELPPAGEEAALARWHGFLDEGLPGYARRRDRADLDGTSRLSPYLALGVLHPGPCSPTCSRTAARTPRSSSPSSPGASSTPT